MGSSAPTPESICPTSNGDTPRCCPMTATAPHTGSEPASLRCRASPSGVIISDTFGRPWRRGVTDVAIGCAGIAAVVDLKGTADALGRELMVTEVCVADEIAAAADLVCGKARGVPVAIARGIDQSWLRRSSVRTEIVREPAEDLFR